ncbi:MAG TPA: mannose-1-phosphate guanylyltransferase [Polyangiaceae bacterium]|jgi:mannose-1-phosphate guanylyltransferase
MSAHVHAVILAGGAGTRFWPASRRLKPKQLLPLAGNGDEPLIAATVRRLEPLIPPERVWIATGQPLVEATARALPRVPRSHFLAEPVPRNTAPCIGWATATIARADPDAVVAVLPADHHIGDEPAFRETLARAIGAAEQGWITTIGIRPTRPETGYGYIEIGDAVGDGVHATARFVEKPDAERAKALLATKRYLWNAGMFFYQARVMAGAIAKHLPALSSGLAAIDAAGGSADEAAVLAEVFPKLPSISIDHGVMEKAERVAVVPGSFDWNDIGSWESAWEMAERDAQGNAAPEGTIAIDAKQNLVRDLTAHRTAKRWALVGVSDLVIVETDDAVLVIPRSRVQEVRAVVDALQARGEGERT